MNSVLFSNPSFLGLHIEPDRKGVNDILAEFSGFISRTTASESMLFLHGEKALEKIHWNWTCNIVLYYLPDLRGPQNLDLLLETTLKFMV